MTILKVRHVITNEISYVDLDEWRDARSSENKQVRSYKKSVLIPRTKLVIDE